MRLTLVLAVVPFALGLVDLIVRGRRRGLPFKPALRALRTRLGVALLGGAPDLDRRPWRACSPPGAALPLSPFTDVARQPAGRWARTARRRIRGRVARRPPATRSAAVDDGRGAARRPRDGFGGRRGRGRRARARETVCPRVRPPVALRLALAADRASVLATRASLRRRARRADGRAPAARGRAWDLDRCRRAATRSVSPRSATSR